MLEDREHEREREGLVCLLNICYADLFHISEMVQILFCANLQWFPN